MDSITTQLRRWLWLTPLIVLLAALLPAHTATAGGTVNSCNETALDAALAGGGVVTFTCGPATIVVSTMKVITQNTTINGGGVITLSGNSATRIFSVTDGISLTLASIRLSDGYAGAANGGAIFNNGSLNITSTNFSSNNATNGGAIHNEVSATLVVNNSLFSTNITTATNNSGGGAILSFGQLRVTGSSFFNNNSNGSPGGAIQTGDGIAVISNSTFISNVGQFGGAIANDFATSLTIINSTFTGNSSTQGAGGAIDSLSTGSLTILNSTFANNSVVGSDGFNNAGGAIWSSTSFVIVNSTFSANRVLSNPVNASAGAIFGSANALISNTTFMSNTAEGTMGGNLIWDFGVLTMTNSIVAGGIPNNCAFTAGIIASLGHNLESANDCSFTSIGDLTNTNPLLGPLQNNGGATLTRALLAGSPAINAGDNSRCPATDQRGVMRPQGVKCDIGAFEYESPAGLSVSNSSPTVLGNPTAFTATLSIGPGATYAWGFGDGSTGSGTNTAHTYAATGTYIAVVTATNSAGFVSATTTAQVNDVAITGLGAQNSGPTKLGNSTAFTATINAGTNVTYLWSFGDGFVGSGITTSHVYSSPGIYTATVTASNVLNSLQASTVVSVTRGLYLPVISR